jgi:hypothetical protein
MAKEELPENSILKHYVDICNLVDGEAAHEKRTKTPTTLLSR